MSAKPHFIIRESWTRTDPALVAFFRDLPASLVADALGGFGVLDHEIRPVWKGPAFIGTALPVETGPQDLLAVHVAFKYAQPGDVLVVATGRSLNAAVIGGITTARMRHAGLVGAVTDGVVRDLAVIEENGVPVYARGISAGTAFKKGPGRIGLPVSVGDVAVEAGDIVMGDRDSVVVIPQHQAEHTRDAIAQAHALEAKLETARTIANAHPSWAEEALAHCEITIVR